MIERPKRRKFVKKKRKIVYNRDARVNSLKYGIIYFRADNQ